MGRDETDDDGVYLRRLLLTIGIGAAAAIVWLLADLLLLVFAAVLLAVALTLLAQPIERATGLGRRISITLAGLAVLALISSAVYLFGAQIALEFRGLEQRLPQDFAQFSMQLNLSNWKELLQTGSASTMGNLLTRMLSWGITLAGAVASIVLVVFGGMYLALDPDTYRHGLMKLVPSTEQERVGAALDECAEALRRWIGVQLVAMVLIGGVTAAGLALIGVPSALALGLIAGLAEAIPYLGPIAAAAPALIVAFSQDTQTLWWTLAVVVGVQQIENNILMPLLASRSVSIPPALAMFALVAMGILFGPMGLLLGFPLTVVACVMIKRLYIQEALGKPVEVMTSTQEVFTTDDTVR